MSLPSLLAGYVDGARSVESSRTDGLERDESYDGDADYKRGFGLGAHDIRVRIELYKHEHRSEA